MALSKRVRRERRRELNRKDFPSEAWFERELKKKNVGAYERNFCLEKVFFGDFVWPSKRIVVELDGSSHNGKEEYDAKRDRFLRSRKWTVVRIRFPVSKASLEAFFKDWGHRLPKKRIKKDKVKEKKMPTLGEILNAERNRKAIEDLERRREEFKKSLSDRRREKMRLGFRL